MGEILRQHCGFVNLSYPQEEFPFPIAASHDHPQQRIEIFAGQAMAQPLLDYKPENDVYTQSWSNQSAIRREQYPHAAARSAIADNTASAPHSAWDASFAEPHGLPMEPLIMQEKDLLNPNNHISYDSFVKGQNITGNGGYNFGFGSSWAFPTASGMQRQASVLAGSELETRTSSMSPQSFFSEPSDHLITPKIMPDRGSPYRGWAEFELAWLGDTRQSSSQIQSNTDTAILRNVGLGVVPSVERNNTNSIEAAIELNETEWPISHLRNENSDALYPVQCSRYQPTLPYYQNSTGSNAILQGQHRATPPYDHGDGPDAMYYYYPDGGEPYHEALVQGESFQLVRNADDPAQRKAEDDILLDGKAAGLTYKEIRKKMGTKVAESTLRGRYRSLTKAKKDRVRKPMWKEQDIRLLTAIVTSELERLDGGYRPLTEGQRMARISWKKVADYIAEHGGSYHFGNSTCKKKWAELKGSH